MADRVIIDDLDHHALEIDRAFRAERGLDDAGRDWREIARIELVFIPARDHATMIQCGGLQFGGKVNFKCNNF